MGRSRHGMRKLHGPLALALFLGLALAGGCIDLDAPPCAAVTDGNPCTLDKCVNDVTTHTNAPKGSACGAGGKLQCDGAGSCVGCKDDSECEIQEPCAVWKCDIGVCTRVLKAEGTSAGNETPEDCSAEYCNATGQTESRAESSDFKDDKQECTFDTCDNGTPLNTPVPDGTKCGTGCQTCTGGECGDCSEGYVCNAMAEACVPLQQLPVGSACTFTTDCESGNCVDGVCCDSPCDSPCMACSSAKTGQPDGTCNPIATGTDPDNECQSPEGDVCNAGQCQCYNGKQDGAELKVDCGGICTPCPGKWECDGSPPCEGTPNPACCGSLCGLCGLFGDDCKQLQGQSCKLEVDQPKKFSLGPGSTPACSAQNSQACFSAMCYCK